MMAPGAASFEPITALIPAGGGQGGSPRGQALIIRAGIIAAILLVAACSPNVPPASPAVVQHRKPPADWFHQQLAAAREAKRDHQPASDIAGAQKAHDDIIVAACERLALAGSNKYAARCNGILRHTVPPPQSPDCDDTDVDPNILRACND